MSNSSKTCLAHRIYNGTQQLSEEDVQRLDAADARERREKRNKGLIYLAAEAPCKKP